MSIEIDREPDTRETYTPGHTPAAMALMAARSLESHCAFAIPLLNPGLSVLDAGCGPGTITHDIAEAVFPGRVTGADQDPAQVEHAERLAEGLERVNARFVCASTYHLPFAEASFDVVISHSLFEHLAEPAVALGELRRVLRPGGTIALCSPDWDEFELMPFPEAVSDAIAAYRDMQARNGGNARAGASLASWLRAAGFKVVEEGSRYEDGDPPALVGEFLAAQLEAANQHAPASAVRQWAARPEARFRQCWRHAVAIR